MIFPSHDHGHRLAADRRKMIKRASFLEGRRLALLVGQDNISALHIIAGEDDLGHGNLWLNIDDANLPRVDIRRTHGLHQFFLPLEPRRIAGVIVGPHNGKPVANADAFVLPAVDVYVVAVCPGELVVGLLAGNEPEFSRDLLVRHKTRAIHHVVVGCRHHFRSGPNLLGRARRSSHQHHQ